MQGPIGSTPIVQFPTVLDGKNPLTDEMNLMMDVYIA